MDQRKQTLFHEGFIGQMFRTFAKFIAPPEMPSPLLWGDEATVRERFGPASSHLRLARVNYRFDFAISPDGVVDLFRMYYGPATRAFDTLPEAERTALGGELVELWRSHNLTREPEHTIVDGEYLEVVATKK